MPLPGQSKPERSPSFSPLSGLVQQVGGDEPPPRFSAPRQAAVRECLVRSTVTVGGGRSPLSFADIMKAFLCLCAFLFVLPCGVFAADGFSLSITNTTVAN